MLELTPVFVKGRIKTSANITTNYINTRNSYNSPYCMEGILIFHYCDACSYFKIDFLNNVENDPLSFLRKVKTF